MKKLTLLLLFFVLQSGIAQVTVKDTVHLLIKQDYQLKSRHQKIAAWSLLGGGFVLGTVGTAISVDEAGKGIGDIFNVLFSFNQKPPGFNEGKFNTGLSLMFIGGTATVVSIPFFIGSARKKKKAASLSIGNMLVPQMNGLTISNKTTPSLIIKLRL